MPTQPNPEIYPALQRKLATLGWQSTASEAHGILTGLACRGITLPQLREKITLFHLPKPAETKADANPETETETKTKTEAESESEALALLQGMYELLLRDLNSNHANSTEDPDDTAHAAFPFNLFLPPAEQTAPAAQVEALADWCNGFMQGFLHDGETHLTNLTQTTPQIAEAARDIITISTLTPDADADPNNDADADPAAAANDTEKRAFEIEQYLRVAVQLIFDEYHRKPKPHPIGASPNPTPNPTWH